MQSFVFQDALAGAEVRCSFPGMDTSVAAGAVGEPCASLFFPGCSLANYALPWVEKAYRALSDAGAVDGISLLCCGKILEYEPDADAAPSFKAQLADRIARAGVKRIVAACPNCAFTLRKLLSADGRTRSVRVVALPQTLAALGYRVSEESVGRVAFAEGRAHELMAAGAGRALSVHDSCPDRSTGEFADGLRALMPSQLIAEPAHVRSRSFCCGSRPNAVGRHDVACKMAAQNAGEARALGACGMVTACMSCTFLLNWLQSDVPAFHYLEFLEGERIDWAAAGSYRKVRYLFEYRPSARAFVGLDAEGERR